MNDNNNTPTPQKSKRERIIGIIYIILAVLLFIATISTAFTARAVESAVCDYCGGTANIISYTPASATTHKAYYLCNTCFKNGYSVEVSCIFQTDDNGDLSCAYCYQTKAPSHDHGATYAKLEKIDDKSHKLIELCSCGEVISTTVHPHYLSDPKYSYLDIDSHVLRTDCACGYYKVVEYPHNLVNGLITNEDNTNHYISYKCDTCDGTVTLAEPHIIKNYHDPCSACGYTKPTDFRLDMNIRGGKYSNNNFSAITNDFYTISDQIELNDDGILTVWGWIAINGGTKQFSYQLILDDGTNVTLDLANRDANKALSDSIISNITNSGLNIKNYTVGAHYNINIDLSYWKDHYMVLALYCESNDGQQEIIAVFNNIKLGNPQTITPPTDTEDTTEPPTEDETEKPGYPVITPPNIDLNTPELNEAYNMGYQQAIKELQHGVFGDIRVKVAFFMYSKELNDNLVEHVEVHLVSLDGGLSFGDLYSDWKKQYGDTDKFTLYEIQVHISFPAGFIWSNDLLYFSGGSQITYTDLPIELLVFTVDENETEHDVTYKNHYDRYYWNIAQGDQYSRTEMIKFTIDDKRLSFENLLVAQNLTLYANGIQYSTDISSYQQGKADGYDKGWIDASENMDNIVNTQSYTDGYNKGLEKGYNQGYKAGELIGRSNGLKEKWNWYDMILSIPDAHLEVFQGLFNITIFGVNMMTFVMSLITLIVLWKVKKFIL